MGLGPACIYFLLGACDYAEKPYYSKRYCSRISGLGALRSAISTCCDRYMAFTITPGRSGVRLPAVQYFSGTCKVAQGLMYVITDDLNWYKVTGRCIVGLRTDVLCTAPLEVSRGDATPEVSRGGEEWR